MIQQQHHSPTLSPMHRLLDHLRKNKLLILSLLCGIIFVIPSLLFPTEVFEWTNSLTLKLLTIFDGFYLILGLFFFLFCIGIAVSPYGKIKLGYSDDEPEYSVWSWIAMLYSTGMGSGLIIRAVQEPVAYYQNPPIEGMSGEAAQTLALQYAYFHWGFSAWAFYAVIGLIMAWFHYKRHQKALISDTLKTILPSPKLAIPIDLLAVIATIFGVIASVGFGSGMIVGGTNHLLSQEFPPHYAIWAILIVSVLSCMSAISGLDKGIKLISNINIGGTLLLLAFFFFQNNFFHLVQQMGNSLWAYGKEFFEMSLAIGKHGHNPKFTADWTIFYWAFWLAWAPFTGMFIARISRGRTIRSFIGGVLIIPSFGTFLWFSVFGTIAFEIVDTLPNGYEGQFDNLFTATFQFFELYPMSNLLNIVTICLMFTYLITSMDSAIFVISMMTDKGKSDPTKFYKVFWGIMLPLIACTAVWLGGDNFLRSTSNLLIITALPFSFVSLVMVYAFLKDLRKP
ncbi:MAG: BCCT family transporter [Chitinophagales bacterium]